MKQRKLFRIHSIYAGAGFFLENFLDVLHQVPSIKPDSCSNSGRRKGKTVLDEDDKESKKKKIELGERKILLEERKLKLREDDLTEAREARIMQNKRNDEEPVETSLQLQSLYSWKDSLHIFSTMRV